MGPRREPDETLLEALLRRSGSFRAYVFGVARRQLYIALIVAAVEAQQVDGPAENTWIQAAAGHVFNSPMYRILMWAATPRLLFKGALLRWSAFFRGSTLRATVDGSSAEIVLDCPHELFTADLAGILSTSCVPPPTSQKTTKARSPSSCFDLVRCCTAGLWYGESHGRA